MLLVTSTNIFREFFAGIRDSVGGRSSAYEVEPRKAKTTAPEKMQATRAGQLWGNAVLAGDLDNETIQVGSGGGMLMVSASGTAVVLE